VFRLTNAIISLPRADNCSVAQRRNADRLRQMGFFNRRSRAPGGVFETTERIPLDEGDEKKARRSTLTRTPQDVEPGLHVFRASNNQTFRDAALRHNLALEHGYYSELTQIDRRNWHVFVKEQADAMDEAVGIGPINGEGVNADGPAPAARLVERAHELTNPMLTSLPEQAETLIAAGPAAVLGQDTWEAWSQGDQDCAVIISRAGFFIRLAELDLLPAARDHDHPTWEGVGNVAIEMFNRFHDTPDGAMPVIAAAASIAQTPTAAKALLESIPGPPPDARVAAVDVELEYLREKGFKPSGTDLAQHRSLMVYGFAAAVVREFILVAQERGDAEREGRSPNI
jgi:hypothetical protein